MLDQPRMAAIIGAGVALALLVVWIFVVGVDGFGLFSFAFRLVHVLSAMVWVGLIVFVNFVQLEAARLGDDATRKVLHGAIAPNVAWWIRHGSTLTVVSGIALLVATGYLVPALVYGTAVYVPPSRATMLWAGVVAAFFMWMFVHMYIWPNMQIVIGKRSGDIPTARARVMLYARLNLVLALPVTLVMVAAAHLY